MSFDWFKISRTGWQNAWGSLSPGTADPQELGLATGSYPWIDDTVQAVFVDDVGHGGGRLAVSTSICIRVAEFTVQDEH